MFNVLGHDAVRVYVRCTARAAGAHMNGARHESAFTLEDLDTTPAEQRSESPAAPQESQNGGNSQQSIRGLNAPRAGENLDSMDASDLWLDAGK